jgi:hypothetical protein
MIDFSAFVLLASVSNNDIDSSKRLGISIPFISDFCLIEAKTDIPVGSNWKFAGYLHQRFTYAGKIYRVENTRKLWLDSSTIYALLPIAASEVIIELPDYFVNWQVKVFAKPYQPQASTGNCQYDPNIQVTLDLILAELQRIRSGSGNGTGTSINIAAAHFTGLI